MKKIIFIIFSVIVLILFCWSIISAEQNEKQLETAEALVKEKLKVSDTDILGVCIYDKESIIVTLKQNDYFVIKNGQVKIIDAINSMTKEKYKEILVDNEFSDVYWVLENCR